MRIFAVLTLCMALAAGAFATPLSTSARFVIPSEVQQIISVDYRALKASPTALALKNRVLPDNLKQFETSVRAFGLDPDKDIEQLSFISFHTKDGGTQVLGVAQGQFPYRDIMKRFTLKKVKPTKYRTSYIYPANGGVEMTFLDESTMLFGDSSALKIALDTRDGEAQS